MVRGGRLDGWRYTFITFVCSHVNAPGHELHGCVDDVLMEVMATPPHWPFPCRLRMRAGRDYMRLLPVRSDVAPMLDAAVLVDRCIQYDNELRALERVAPLT